MKGAREIMLHDIHEHINQEVRINTKTDTIFVVTAIIFNLIMLGVSSALAAAAADELGRTDAGTTSAIVLAINLAISLLINGVSVIGLLTGRATRKTLSQGLLKMYEDADVIKYYGAGLLTNYMRRYIMFISIIAILGTSSILIPLVVLLTA
jgi:hypothetical protein